MILYIGRLSITLSLGLRVTAESSLGVNGSVRCSKLQVPIEPRLAEYAVLFFRGRLCILEGEADILARDDLSPH